MANIRFYRRIPITSLIRLNVSKTGISLSIGKRGWGITFGKSGVQFTAGLTGTGLFATQHYNYRDIKDKFARYDCEVKHDLEKYSGGKDGKKER